METVEIEPVEIRQRKADDRGRVNLGTAYADSEVRVAVVEVVDGGEHDG